MNPDEVAARIAAGQELRRRGKLTPQQDAALKELERRYPGPAVNNAMAVGDTATARIVAEDQEAMHTAAGSSGAGRTWEPAPEAAGREFAKKRGPVGAAVQGVGSLAFGLGTPAAAADEYLRSRVRGKPRSWEESREFAEGLREGSKDEHPIAYGFGALTGLVGSGSVVRQGVRRLPAAARSVFDLQAGQTVKNIGKMMGAGATASAVTAGNQEGIEAVPGAAVVGGVAGPVAGTLANAGVNAARWAVGRISPESAAIRMLAKRMGETADAIAGRYNQFVAQYGRRPRLIEIMRRETAEEMGQLSASKVGAGAGQVFREAEEAAALARPGELREIVERGGRSTTVPEQQADLAPIVDETRDLINSRVLSTETAQIARRDKVMDAVMGRIGNHRVPLSDDMRDVLEDPDVQKALSPALRRRINDVIAQGEDIGTVDLSIRSWEMMRQALAGKAGPGAGKIFSRLRDRVRDYVSERVPEYGKALEEFGRRTASAKSTTKGREALTKDVREFADQLRSTETRAAVRVSERVGARAGARTALANAFRHPGRARKMMERLVVDDGLRANLREILSPVEIRQLETLAESYGHKLNIIEGVKLGQKVMPASDAVQFDDAVRAVKTQKGGEIGVRTGARGAFAGKAGESPSAAIGVAEAVSEHPGLQQRLVSALGGVEASRISTAMSTSARATRNLSVAAPSGTEAQARRIAQAQKVQEFLTGVVTAGGRASGALRVQLMNNVRQRLGLSSAAAKRLAEMAVDPERAHVYINRMRAAGVRENEIIQWYQSAAVAAGMLTSGAAMD